jgi:6-phosphogluconolactonase
VVTTKNGRFAYTTNTGSGSISTYRIGTDGSLSLQNPTSAATGSGPIDAALSKDSHYLYALSSGAVDAFRVADDGSLTAITGASGLPAGSVGLAAS